MYEFESEFLYIIRVQSPFHTTQNIVWEIFSMFERYHKMSSVWKDTNVSLRILLKQNFLVAKNVPRVIPPWYLTTQTSQSQQSLNN